ncbi:MAG: lactonase family protein [Candidatus Acidiferrales bacterium]
MSFTQYRRRSTALTLLPLLALALGALSMVGNAADAARQKSRFYVGTYTDHGSKGIYAYSFDSATGASTSQGLAAESAQPSFFAIATSGRFLYAVNEISEFNGQPTGAVSAFAIQPKTAKLTLLNQVSSRGAAPAHIALDRSGKYALVSNYDAGSVTVFPLLEDGSLGEATAFVQHKGSSVNKERQEGPHAHAAAFSPDNRFVIVADLGLDQLLVYRFDAAAGTLGSDPQVVRAVPGAGPRHLVFDAGGRHLYVINEMQSTVVTYAYDAANGTLSELQIVSALPKGFARASEAAEIEIHSSGKFLFASNRGDDSIAVFAVNAKDGTLTPLEFVSTGGKTPRNFELDPTGAWLLVANQDSDDIVVFRVDPSTGHLTRSGTELHVPSPVCVRFVPAP